MFSVEKLVGVNLFEMLTGTLPYQAESSMLMVAQRLIKAAPDPRTRRPDLSAAVAAVVLRCLAKNPADRFASAYEVAVALSQVPLPAGSERVSGGMPQVASAVPRPPTLQAQGVISGPLALEVLQQGLSSPTASALPPVIKRSRVVAVLPFKNQGTAEDEYLADALSEEIVDGLSMLKGVRVRSRGAVTALVEQPGEARALGRELGIQVVVEGSVRRYGQTLRVSARLVNLDDDYQIWAQRFDRPAAEALAISDEVTQAIAGALTVEHRAPAQAPLSDAQAVDLYLRARHFYYLGTTQSLGQTVSLLEQALQLSPDNPTLLTGYALGCSRLWFFGGEGSGVRAKAAAERAMRAAPERAEPLLALAVVKFHEGDSAMALRLLRQALSRSPMLADAHELIGRILVESGPLAEGVRSLGIALDLDPSLKRIALDLSRAYALAGVWPRADAYLEQFLAESSLMGVWNQRARLLLWRRDTAGALRVLADPKFAAYASTNPRTLEMMQVAAGKKYLDATRATQGLGIGQGSSSPRSRAFMKQLFVEVHAYFNELEPALRLLALSVEDGLADLQWMDYCPLLASLRPDPRFAALRATVAERVAQVLRALREPI